MFILFKCFNSTQILQSYHIKIINAQMQVKLQGLQGKMLYIKKVMHRCLRRYWDLNPDSARQTSAYW